jgi:flavin-dependent dehydrogenase
MPGVFLVGNAAGEAHPIVAEGISMALQAGGLLARHLIAWAGAGRRPEALAAVAASYTRAWRRHFAPRLRVAALLAHWAMQPASVALSTPLLRCFPQVLSLGARLSGKVTRVT